MFKNHFIVALRNFKRNKLFSLINIAGLAIGISASLVIYLIVYHEFSYEKFHRDRDRIYRVVTNMHFPDMDFKNSGVPGPLPSAVRNEIPGIESSTSFFLAGEKKVNVSDNQNNPGFRSQDKIVYADSAYFQFIPYEWIAGNPGDALKGPGKVVLTENRARNYFAFTDISNALGQSIVYDDSVKTVVTGIVRDLEEVTEFTFQEFISLPTFERTLIKQQSWDQWGSVTSSSQFFVKLREGVDPEEINKELTAVRDKHKKEAYLDTDHFLQKLSDIHFNPELGSLGESKGHKPTLYGLLAVAAFLLLLGCINFINLTTAQASQRAKEIGIRKMMGSSKRQLISQFLSETFLLTLLAGAISMLMIPGILKIFSDFIPANLALNLREQPHLLIFMGALIISVSFFSGIYPALVLSGYKPVNVIKNVANAESTQTRRAWLRKTLTISQFVIAQFFIIASLVVMKQIRYSLNKDMGFKKEAIINLYTPFKVKQGKRFVLQEKLKAIPGIKMISLSGNPPASNSTSSTTMKFNKDGEEIETTVEVKNADSSYFKLYDMHLVAGRNLTQSDTIREYVVNETLTKFLGYTDPAEIVGEFVDRNNRKLPVVGVIADFNTKSVHQAIKPLAFTCQASSHHIFHLALSDAVGNTDDWKKTIAGVEKSWTEVYPEDPFRHTFFDESIAKFYKEEQDIARLMKWSTGLTIFISCLGLLGLVIFTTTQRIKEIGIRKVLGATVTQIVLMLSKDFILLVGLAFLIAAPLAWWAMQDWLNDFAYRTSISWWIFVLSGLSMILIALITLSVQTIRSAVANPVESLRAE